MLYYQVEHKIRICEEFALIELNIFVITGLILISLKKL